MIDPTWVAARRAIINRGLVIFRAPCPGGEHLIDWTAYENGDRPGPCEICDGKS